jgi:hypothetical protein
MQNVQSTTTQLLTLLNVSALKSTKRKRLDEVPFAPGRKLNARNKPAMILSDKQAVLGITNSELGEKHDVEMDEDRDQADEDGTLDEEASE